jgi:hypothetical protein
MFPQRFPSSKLVLKIVGYRFAALNYDENGSTAIPMIKEGRSHVFPTILK